MDIDREIQIRKMAASGAIHGIMASETKALEAKYGIRCESYSCGHCVLTFLKRLDKIKPLSEVLKEAEEYGKEQTEQ